MMYLALLDCGHYAYLKVQLPYGAHKWCGWCRDYKIIQTEEIQQIESD